MYIVQCKQSLRPL